MGENGKLRATQYALFKKNFDKIHKAYFGNFITV